MSHAPGESLGHSMVRIQDGGQTAFCVGDLFHFPCEVENLDWVSPGRERTRMPGHTLLVHPDVENWMHAQPDLRRRVDWLLFELGTRGDAGRPKGIVGPAALATDAPAVRWRRSGVGGFHYYAWWFPAIGFCQGAFALFTMYLPPLFPTLLRTTGAGFCYNIGRIVAAAGTVFFGLFSKVGDFRRENKPGAFRSWLRVITRNKIFDFGRRVQKEPPGQGGSDWQARLAESPDTESSDIDTAGSRAEERLLYRQALEIVRQDFEERTWQAFWQVVIDGREVAEVAQALAVTANAVYLAKSRVLRRLRRELDGLLD